MKTATEVTMNESDIRRIKALKLAPLPRSVSGLKNDGTRDKRFKAGHTLPELIKSMVEVAGTIKVFET